MFRFLLIGVVTLICDSAFAQSMFSKKSQVPPSPGMYWQESDKFWHDRMWVKPEKQDEASFLGTDGIWHPKPGACWCGVGLSGKWAMPATVAKQQYVLIDGRWYKLAGR